FTSLIKLWRSWAKCELRFTAPLLELCCRETSPHTGFYRHLPEKARACLGPRSVSDRASSADDGPFSFIHRFVAGATARIDAGNIWRALREYRNAPRSRRKVAHQNYNC